MSVEVVFETHSLTTDNEQGLATGWLDGHLSEAGKRLAAELGERRRDQSLAAVFTSDLRRATETTEIAFGDAGIPTFEDRRLRECNYGLLNGMPVQRLERESQSHIEEPWPEGESYRQVVQRVEAFLGELPNAGTTRGSSSSATRRRAGRWTTPSAEPRSSAWSRPHSDGRRGGCTGSARTDPASDRSSRVT